MKHTQRGYRALRIGLALAFIGWIGSGHTQTAVTGRWIAPADAPNEPAATIVLEERAGEVRGTIERLFVKPGEDPNPMCSKCKGERKGKPVVGMEVVWGLKRGGGAGAWQDGHALDPEDGTIYRMEAKLSPDGRRLDVRYYKGIALFGYTEVWNRPTETVK
jgi:uncharacterized protein (DUF2147 family)